MCVQTATASAAARREAALGIALYAVYLWTARGAGTPERRAQALRNAAWVARAEGRLGLGVEEAVQRAALRHRRGVHALSVAYGALNVALTVGWLVLLFRRRDPAYAGLRRAAVWVVVGAAPVFRAFPCAPPRSTGRLVDTIAEVSGVDLESPWLRRFYNPLAAMPSIHVAFAVVAGWGIAASRPQWWARWAGAGYPPLVAVTVVATGNHFVLDVLAGLALGVGALRASGRRLARR